MGDNTNQTGKQTGAFSTLGQNVNFSTPASVVTSQINDGDRFILIKQTRQGDQPQVWSSGDSEETQQLYRQAMQHIGVRETTS